MHALQNPRIKVGMKTKSYTKSSDTKEGHHKE